VVVENRPGASTIIGAELVARSAPDGHTLLMAATPTLATNPMVFKKLPYKISDFVPVALAAKVPLVLAAHHSIGASSVQELVAYTKANPEGDLRHQWLRLVFTPPRGAIQVPDRGGDSRHPLQGNHAARRGARIRMAGQVWIH
jgi:hypothetical protein